MRPLTSEMVMQLASNAIFHVLLLATPLLGAGLLVGLVVSILQATTQIQEQTLAFIPKIIAILLSLLIFGPWMLATMVDYAKDMFQQMITWIG